MSWRLEMKRLSLVHLCRARRNRTNAIRPRRMAVPKTIQTIAGVFNLTVRDVSRSDVDSAVLASAKASVEL